ncbi:FecR domain-containing protein [Flagellatimonas centrodinii]|uniref:FecR family protein n=1 Tax=Flagellatimonas centrodinii TaxID=2806210 RepID=UPI001FEEB628|nr:FecR domain-containing protein [Flagellatimonas centrodinii]ULQ47670.1 FecR domain-containing protein [Flagellatimonas centrodinii]
MTPAPPPSATDDNTRAREAAAWFARLRADDVSGADRAGFEAWLNADVEHRRAYSKLERLWSQAGSFAEDPRLAEAVRKTRAAVAPSPVVAAAPARRRRSARWLAVAASLAVVAVAAWWAQPWLMGNRTVTTAVGEQRSLVLADGSRVTVNTDSRLRIGYNERRRTVTLERGQAYFEVAKEHRPFEVVTRSGVVRALGTAFDVFSGRERFVVTVVEGSVVVSDADTEATHAADDTLAGTPAKPAGGQVLRARERLARATDTAIAAAAARPDAAATVAPVQIEAAPIERDMAWLRGKLIFDNEPLAAAVAEINRYTRKPIRIADPALASLRMSGVFRVGEVGDFVNAVSGYFSLRVDMAADGGYVLHSG